MDHQKPLKIALTLIRFIMPKKASIPSPNIYTPTSAGSSREETANINAITPASADREGSVTPGPGTVQRGRNWSERDSILLTDAHVHTEQSKRGTYIVQWIVF